MPRSGGLTVRNAVFPFHVAITGRVFSNLLAFRKALPRRTEIILGMLGFALFLTVWHIIAASGSIRPEFLPRPISVAQAFVRLFTERDFASDIVISVGRVWFAFFLSVIVALPLGLIMSTYRSVGAVLETIHRFRSPIFRSLPWSRCWSSGSASGKRRKSPYSGREPSFNSYC